ncbi:MAG: response regulator [Hydrogenophaga sp.]|uniref:hybrid sensor histidine kinase/response regulator n=1 Tax=Hydrogenophaga sp. TaxID=1904254 RepID=UPI001DF3A4CB|nr:ATP-binding protein [Hydrogenophaga sp.]MBX3608988.1 response regulator [Hydrogenophaga sp.]
MALPDSAQPIAAQKIFRFRREYNSWVADETMEDYALRYAPRSFRKWSEWRVANTSFGSLSFLALEAIGGAIAVNYGFTNAMWAILVVGLIIFFTGLPIAYYAARHGLDMDLLTRGAGFGYLGSTITSLIYAVFTFIFFAIEAVIMALALQLATDWPLPVCYLVSAVVAIPLAMKGITLISRLQVWTQPLYLFLLLLPFVWIALSQPQLYRDFTSLTGLRSGSSGFQPLMFGAAAAVIFSLVVQIGEQVDFLRFMPERTAKNRVRWWLAVLIPGPGWIVMGMLKMLGGAFLAFAAMQFEVPTERTAEPTQMFLAGFTQAVGHPGLAVLMTVVFVILAQIKINVTNAYAGSLAWSNFFARVTHSHPGRVVWLVFNVAIATLLMLLGVFAGIEKVLGVYSNVAIAWVGALVADLIINKPLGLSPRGIEFRRAYLYDFNPVGMGSMIIAALVASVAYSGVLGEVAEAFSPFIALGLALLLSPLLAWATKGRYYLARQPAQDWAPGQVVRCAVCENQFESEDMASCPAYRAPICSLCCSLESRCHDRCKTNARAIDQLRGWLGNVLPQGLAARVNFRAGQFLLVWLSICAIVALLMGMVYAQESLHGTAHALQLPLLKIYAFLVLFAAVCSWWVVLTTDSRRMAQDESERQTQLLTREIEAHQRTDAELQSARDRAEAASQAKTRYVAGMTHELRTPLTSILGYAQILLKNSEISVWVRETIATMQRSGTHMHALIDGSLDLARIEAGRLRLDPVPLPLQSLLQDVERMVRPQAEAKGLRFTVEHKGELPAWVRADAKRLRQILINLLSNAVRFTDEGQVTLRLDFRQQVARIDVVDTGIGIAEQDQKRIFLPYERGSAGRRAADSGTGLGLTITHLLTDMMGGELLLKSAPGKGSTFSLRLYLPAIPTDPQHPMEMPSAMRTITGYLGERRTVLVVDDQALHRQLLASILVPLGFLVREAASGQECLEIIEQHPPDILLLDLTMDGLDGWQTAEAVRRLLPSSQLPIVFVSANLLDNRPPEFDNLDYQGFVAKPISESELLDAVRDALELEWVTEAALSAPATDTGRLRRSGLPLPAALREELQRLARQGQAAALRQRLWQAQGDEPAHAATLAMLLACAERFDFQTLTDYLRDTEEHADDDTLV